MAPSPKERNLAILVGVLAMFALAPPVNGLGMLYYKGRLFKNMVNTLERTLPDKQHRTTDIGEQASRQHSITKETVPANGEVLSGNIQEPAGIIETPPVTGALDTIFVESPYFGIQMVSLYGKTPLANARIVPIDKEMPQVIGERIPSSEQTAIRNKELVSNEEEPLEYGEIVSYNRDKPSGNAAILPNADTLPETVEMVPKNEHIAVQNKEMVPINERTPLSNQDIVPTIGESAIRNNEMVPIIEKWVSIIAEMHPNKVEMTPIHEQMPLRNVERVQTNEQTNIRNKEMVPINEETAPGNEEVVPTNVQTAIRLNLLRHRLLHASLALTNARRLGDQADFDRMLKNVRVPYVI